MGVNGGMASGMVKDRYVMYFDLRFNGQLIRFNGQLYHSCPRTPSNSISFPHEPTYSGALLQVSHDA